MEEKMERRQEEKMDSDTILQFFPLEIWNGKWKVKKCRMEEKMERRQEEKMDSDTILQFFPLEIWNGKWKVTFYCLKCLKRKKL